MCGGNVKFHCKCNKNGLENVLDKRLEKGLIDHIIYIDQPNFTVNDKPSIKKSITPKLSIIVSKVRRGEKLNRTEMLFILRALDNLKGEVVQLI
jgi:hypothetical protein